jgi:hypothetical protein
MLYRKILILQKEPRKAFISLYENESGAGL